MLTILSLCNFIICGYNSSDVKKYTCSTDSSISDDKQNISTTNLEILQSAEPFFQADKYPEENKIYTIFDTVYTQLTPISVTKNMHCKLHKYTDRPDIMYLFDVYNGLRIGIVDVNLARWMVSMYKRYLINKNKPKLKDVLINTNSFINNDVVCLKHDDFVEKLTGSIYSRGLFLEFVNFLSEQVKCMKINCPIAKSLSYNMSNYILYLDLIGYFTMRLKKSVLARKINVQPYNNPDLASPVFIVIVPVDFNDGTEIKPTVKCVYVNSNGIICPNYPNPIKKPDSAETPTETTTTTDTSSSAQDSAKSICDDVMKDFLNQVVGKKVNEYFPDKINNDTKGINLKPCLKKKPEIDLKNEDNNSESFSDFSDSDQEEKNVDDCKNILKTNETTKPKKKVAFSEFSEVYIYDKDEPISDKEDEGKTEDIKTSSCNLQDKSTTNIVIENKPVRKSILKNPLTPQQIEQNLKHYKEVTEAKNKMSGCKLEDLNE
ncbi:hypothetical protein COBT_001735 [Conglomerata obtusa]